MGRIYNNLKLSLLSLKATEYAKKTGKLDWKYFGYNLYFKGLDIFIYSWLTPIKRFNSFLKRCWDYLPILWADRDWDYVYLLVLMQFKIKRMKELHMRYKRHVGVEKTIKQLLICEQLLDRMSKDNYIDQAHEEHNKKWHPNTDFFERLNKHDPKENKEFKKNIIDYGEYMYKQDLELFCKIFKKHVRSWWD